MKTEKLITKIHLTSGWIEVYKELNHIFIHDNDSYDYLELEKEEAKELAQVLLELANG